MNGYPSRYLVVATEAMATCLGGEDLCSELRLRCGVVIATDPASSGATCGVPRAFTSINQFHSLLAELPLTRSPIYILSHQAAIDARLLDWFRWVSMGQYTLMPPSCAYRAAQYRRPLCLVDDPPFVVRAWRRDGQQFVLLDTEQWIGADLTTVAEWIGVEPARLVSDTSTDADALDTCAARAGILRVAITRVWAYLRSHHIRDWALTPGACALGVYTHGYEGGTIVRTDNPDVLSMSRAAYFGGLTELFRVGRIDGPVYHVDVNSLYPYVMSTQPYPCEVLEMRTDVACEPIPRDFRPHECIAEVYIESPKRAYPVRGKDRTLWCTGQIRTVLCGPELDRAINRGDATHIGRWVRFRLDDLFSPYVHYWWRARCAAKLAAKPMQEHACKFMLNSLHGKFGQHAITEGYIGQTHTDRTYGKLIHLGDIESKDSFTRIIGGHEWYCETGLEDPKGWLPAAAWIASAARVEMADWLAVCGPAHVYSIHTDALLMDACGYQSLHDHCALSDHDIGRFKLAGVYSEVGLWNINQVDLGAKKVRSGIKDGAAEIAPDVWSVESWSSLAADLFAGKPSCVSIRNVLKATRSKYSRRRVLPDSTTRPWSVANWHLPFEEQAKAPINLGGE